MKNFSRVSAAGLALVASLGVFAAPAGTRTDGRRTLKLTEATQVLGATMPPGSYELRWARERGSDAVRLEVTRGGTVWAAGRGTWTSSDQPYPYEALVYRNGSGGNALAEIRFRDSADLIRVESTGNGAVATGTP
ncbi:MAG TPA: hypothetical protein VJ826_12060 [Candidatus Polarisedimenticolaceae bacterium]|nr:hypothetical protein [Candidatus Polarisedimenticolaceae bacterium]